MRIAQNVKIGLELMRGAIHFHAKHVTFWHFVVKALYHVRSLSAFANVNQEPERSILKGVVTFRARKEHNMP